MTPDPNMQEPEAQDRAETLDESNLTSEAGETRQTRVGGEIANFDTIDEVYDATRAEDDDDIEGYEDDEYDPDEIREALEAARDDEGRRGAARPEPRTPADDEETPADFESKTDPSEQVQEGSNPHVEKQLEEGLKESFPASDPVSINPGAD